MRNRRWALAALAATVSARMAWLLLTPNGMNLVDLHVYVDGAAWLFTDQLYDFTYAKVTPDFPLPFIYPPFAAVVFFGLHYVPFPVLGVSWILATAAALYGVVRIAFELILGPDTARQERWRTAVIAWTAVGLWMEPIRATMDYGQVNVFLVLVVLRAVRSARWWVSGTLVGLAAGIKLTPAVTGLYFLTQRRWRAAVAAAVVFFGTVGLSFAVNAGETRRYFGTLLGDAERIGPVRSVPAGSVWNQSWRGVLSRFVGHDVGSGPLWLIAVAGTAVLAWAAWRALASTDRLGALLIVQFFGLLLSPISWAHHWVWVLPAVLWLWYGPLRERGGARILAWYWLVVASLGVPWCLSFLQDSSWTFSRPGYQSWLGTVYVAGALAFLVWVAVPRWLSWWSRRGQSRGPTPHPSRSPRPRNASTTST